MDADVCVMNRRGTVFPRVMREARWLSLAVLGMASLANGCSNIERSRSLDNPAVQATTIAEQVCSNCHGMGGRSISPNFPHLAAQQRDYIIEELVDFRRHKRRNSAAVAYMWGMTRSLTDAQIVGLADYFAAQAPATPISSGADGVIAKGREVFEKDVPEKNIRSCGACHGLKAEGCEQFPRLANQHADYLVKQLMVFQNKDGRSDGSIMKIIAHDLTIADIEDVATYLSAGIP